MATPGGRPAKDEPTKLEWAVGLALIVACVVGLVYSASGWVLHSNFTHEAWSRFVLARDLAPAQDALRRGDTERSLRLLQPVLAEHPDDPRTLYLVAGTYLEREDPVRALFYAIAYLRSPRYKDAEQLQRLATTLVNDESLADYLVAGGIFSDDEFGPLVDALPLTLLEKVDFKIRARTEAFTELPAASMAAELKANQALWDAMPRGWQKASTVDPQALLAPNAAAQPASGWLNRSVGTGCGDRWNHAWCGSLFSRVSLWDGVAHGHLKTRPDDKRPGCCELALDDPDLRPMAIVTAEFLKSRAAAGLRPPEETAEGMNALHAFRQRILFKHAYALTYALNADVPDPTR